MTAHGLPAVGPLLADSTQTASCHKAAARTQTGCQACGRPPGLDFSLFRDLQRVIHLDPKVSDCALQLGVAEQKLDGPQVLGSLVDQRSPGPSHWLRRRVCVQ